jgi:very-short-patch-repair endonuclease
LTTKARLRDTADEHRGRKGAPALLAIAGARHVRSDLERLFLTFLTDHGLPLPMTNVYLGRYTADCLYEDHKLIIELDEHGHRSALAFEEDRERDRHHATIGYTTIRVTKPALNAALAGQLRRILLA